MKLQLVLISMFVAFAMAQPGKPMKWDWVFDMFDKNEDAILDVNEVTFQLKSFKKAAADLGVFTLEVKLNDVANLMKFDKNKDGKFTLKEWRPLILDVFKYNQNDDDAWKSVFSIYSNQKEYIDKNDLEKAFNNVITPNLEKDFIEKKGLGKNGKDFADSMMTKYDKYSKQQQQLTFIEWKPLGIHVWNLIQSQKNNEMIVEFRLYDKNQNGKLSRKETIEHTEYVRNRAKKLDVKAVDHFFNGMSNEQLTDKIFEHADINNPKDGELSKFEWIPVAIKTDLLFENSNLWTETFKKADANGDLKISEKEFKDVLELVMKFANERKSKFALDELNDAIKDAKAKQLDAIQYIEKTFTTENQDGELDISEWKEFVFWISERFSAADFFELLKRAITDNEGPEQAHHEHHEQAHQ